MKRVIAFDLDGTLAPSKSPLPDQIATLLKQLLAKYEICVISGGNYGQFGKQLLGGLEASDHELTRLHIMPTCGTRYYLYDQKAREWELQYAEDFTEAEKKKIGDALVRGFEEFGYVQKKTYGETLEDRGSQMTYSVFGQDIVDHLGMEGVEIKEAWDPDNSKKQRVRDFVAPLIPEFEVRVGGITSVDVTKKGVDKAYGMRKLMASVEIGMDDILFIGDRLMEGGNDYPVKAMGIDCVAVKNWEETAVAVQTLLHVAGK